MANCVSVSKIAHRGQPLIIKASYRLQGLAIFKPKLQVFDHKDLRISECVTYYSSQAELESIPKMEGNEVLPGGAIWIYHPDNMVGILGSTLTSVVTSLNHLMSILHT